jgi:hypothetical protein
MTVPPLCQIIPRVSTLGIMVVLLLLGEPVAEPRVILDLGLHQSHEIQREVLVRLVDRPTEVGHLSDLDSVVTLEPVGESSLVLGVQLFQLEAGIELSGEGKGFEHLGSRLDVGTLSHLRETDRHLYYSLDMCTSVYVR